jgi:hypothetical protein
MGDGSDSNQYIGNEKFRNLTPNSKPHFIDVYSQFVTPSKFDICT